MNKAKVVVIVGPTASGKTALSLSLAKKYNGEIISADSRQIYRGMDIGTAKPNKDLRFKNHDLRSYYSENIKHHLIDIRNPDQDYSVGQFKRDAVKAIERIARMKKLPIVVGGTGLYVSALVNNLEIPTVKENKELRAKIEREIRENGLAHVFKKLVELDPEAIYVVDPLNPRRVVRALEVAMLTGKPFTAQRKTGRPLFDFFQIGIRGTPESLKIRITERVHGMIKDGLAEEVKKLVKKYGDNAKPFDAIGYREIIEYLKGEVTLEEATELMVKNTWHYAKRQINWFKKDKRINWISSQREAINLVASFLNEKPAGSISIAGINDYRQIFGA